MKTSYKVVSFVQFPIKSGIWPVSRISLIQLKQNEKKKKSIQNLWTIRSMLRVSKWIARYNNNPRDYNRYNSYASSKFTKLANDEGISPLSPELPMYLS